MIEVAKRKTHGGAFFSPRFFGGVSRIVSADCHAIQFQVAIARGRSKHHEIFSGFESRHVDDWTHIFT
jgi:hypothetical protein